MSEINASTNISISDFVSNVYSINKRPILFWDTCSLLEIIRFLYRNGDVESYRTLNRVNGLIQAGAIYSLASTITIVEWNDHQADVIAATQNSLEKTEEYHQKCIETINEINGTALASESIKNRNLMQDLERLADSILSNTYFIETEEIADKALERVTLKQPPASRKNEFKDCAVWETMILLSDQINSVNGPGDNFNKVFYTVNTDDFVDKSREPRIFYAPLLAEAATADFLCCSSLTEVDTLI